MIHSLLLAGMLAAARIGAGGDVAWFQGGFDDAVREASKAHKLVLVDFRIAICDACAKLDTDTYSNAAVASAMKDFVCVTIDAQSKAGAPLARRFVVSGYPTLVFLDPDGAVRDRIVATLPPDRFLRELKRIQSGEGTVTDARAKAAAAPGDPFARLELASALRRVNDSAGALAEIEAAKRAIKAGQGFDLKSTDVRWALSQKLADLGDGAAAREELAALHALDPEGKSIASRRAKLQELTHAVNVAYAKTHSVDAKPLIAFLRSETEPDVLFEGWNVVQRTELYQVNDARKRESPDEEEFHRAAWRDAGREAWKWCPQDKIADWGAGFAAAMYEDAANLTDEEKSLAVDVATRAAEAAPKSPDHLEVLACCLFAAGKREDALRTLKTAMDIDPSRESLKKRMTEFLK